MRTMHDIRSRTPGAEALKTDWFALNTESYRASVHVSRFAPPGGAEEIHLQVQPCEYGSAEDQLQAIERAYQFDRV